MKNKISSEERLVFGHTQRQYYIQCANHVLALAPLPEFKNALVLLEAYDARPTKRNRDRLKKTYHGLWKRAGHSFGYTAVGEFYRGLKCILYCTLFRPNEVASYHTQSFTEVCFCAGFALRISTAFNWEPERAQAAESKWQQSVWDKLHGRETTASAKEKVIPTIDCGTFDSKPEAA